VHLAVQAYLYLNTQQHNPLDEYFIVQDHLQFQAAQLQFNILLSVAAVVVDKVMVAVVVDQVDLEQVPH
jgi:hypothetical protein